MQGMTGEGRRGSVKRGLSGLLQGFYSGASGSFELRVKVFSLRLREWSLGVQGFRVSRAYGFELSVQGFRVLSLEFQVQRLVVLSLIAQVYAFGDFRLQGCEF